MLESIAKLPPSSTPNVQLQLIAESFFRATGQPLITLAADQSLRDALWNAPCVVVAHGTEVDPIFFYGNRMALQLFGYNFDDFTRLPSRYSAEPLAREARARLLERVTRNGYVGDYSGIRIARTGQRFRIDRATVWNLTDRQNNILGQAATFADWALVP